MFGASVFATAQTCTKKTTMKRTAAISTIIVAVFVIALLGFVRSSVEDADNAILFCPSEGLARQAIGGNSYAKIPGSELCTYGAQQGVQSSELANRVTKINLHQSLGEVYVSGLGFSPNTGLDLDIHIRANGIISAPYSVHLETDDMGNFASDSLHLMCPDPDSSVYVVATDQTGTSHARIFETGEFRC